MPGIVGMGGRVSLASFMARQSDGLWYDFTKTDRHFQENTGPTLADGAGEVIGLALDQRQWSGQTLDQVVAGQSELVTNGGFGADANWTKDTGWTISGGVASNNAPGVTSNLTQNLGLVAGKVYAVTFTLSASASVLAVFVGNSASPFTVSISGTYTRYIVAAGNSTFYIQANAAFVGSIDNVSVKLIPGIPAKQSTSSSKPTFQQPSGRNVIRGDGVDDHEVTALNPTAAMTLIEVGMPDAGSAGDVLIGSQPAADGKAYLALSSSGYLAGGVGTQGTTTIVDQDSVDIRSVRCAKAIRWDGSTASLFVKPEGEAFRKAYEAVQSGAVNTTVPLYLLGLNNNGTLVAAADTDTEHFIAIPSAIPDSKIAQIFNSLL